MAFFLIFLSWSLFTIYLLKFHITQKKYVYFNSAILVFFVFLLYYTYPLLFNLLKGNSYETFYRLNILHITDMENNILSMHIFIGSLGFFISSFFFNKKLFFVKKECSKNDLISYLLIIIIFLFLRSIFSFEFTNSDRLSSYQFIQSQNFQSKVLNKLIHSTYLFVELIFYYKFFQFFKSRIGILKIFFVCFIIYNIFTFSFFDQRSELFMKVIIILISYHIFVRKLSNLQLILFTVISIFLLALWGTLREEENISNYSFDFFVNIGEFDMIYANFIDLYRFPPEDFSLKSKLYDLYAYIPSPLLWFDKETLLFHFMENYHYDYSQRGGGYGLGILAESLYGYGLAETFFKTIILSSFLNYVYIVYSKSKKNIYEIFYLILFVTSPLSIRITSFRFLSDVIQFGIFIFILFILTKSILRILR